MVALRGAVRIALFPLLLQATVCIAQGQGGEALSSGQDGMYWLKRMAAAARQLTYTGTFVYRQGNQIETSRISHLVDSGGEFEKLETLDGPLREVVRRNDEVMCFFPEHKTVRVERRQGRSFPAVLSDGISGIVENYTVRRGDIARVAGYDCQTTHLEPRDALRYGYSFCAELQSGLPLRAKTIDERGETIEMFAFTQVTIGSGVSRDKVRSRFNPKEPGWRLDRSELGATPVDSGWSVANQPAGFRKVLEVKRMIEGRPASHLVFSDGMAAVSVFVESGGAASKPIHGLSHQGAINIYTRTLAEHVVRVLGDTPAATVMQIGNSLSIRPK